MLDEALARAKPLVKKYEGWSAVPYRCPALVWTIGWGATRLLDGTPVGKDSPPITREQGEVLLTRDLRGPATRLIRIASPTLDAARLAALSSFAYNLGVGALLSSTLWRLHKAGNFKEAALQFDRWVFAGGRRLRGLVLRRAEERLVYSGKQ